MSTIRFHLTTTSTPEKFIAGLTDFGPGRSNLFDRSADDYLKVHHRGPRQADVTEGSGGIWDRLKSGVSVAEVRRPLTAEPHHGREASLRKPL